MAFILPSHLLRLIFDDPLSFDDPTFTVPAWYPFELIVDEPTLTYLPDIHLNLRFALEQSFVVSYLLYYMVLTHPAVLAITVDSSDRSCVLNNLSQITIFLQSLYRPNMSLGFNSDFENTSVFQWETAEALAVRRGDCVSWSLPDSLLPKPWV